MLELARTYGELLRRCASRGDGTLACVAGLFGVSAQTVAGWAGAAEEPLPRDLALALAGYEAWRAGPLGPFPPAFPALRFGWLRGWGRGRGLETLEALGRQFGHSRHTLCKWSGRDSLPGWVPLACLAMEAGVPFLPRGAETVRARRKLKDAA